jgi:RES domain
VAGSPLFIAKTAFAAVAAPYKMNAMALGESLYQLSGGEYGQSGHQAYAEMQDGAWKFMRNPFDTPMNAFGEWRSRMQALYDKREYFQYGLGTSNAAGHVVLGVEGGAGMFNMTARAIASRSAMADVSFYKGLDTDIGYMDAAARSALMASDTHPNVIGGLGNSIRIDGHKIYDSAFLPLSTNPSAQYRFSDPTFRQTGGDVYFGENLATAYFEVKQNVNGKSLFVGDVQIKNMLDLTDSDILTKMKVDKGRLNMRVNGPLDQKAIYGYTNEISNQAFSAGYNGIIYPSTRFSGSAVVLFGGRYVPSNIMPILNMPLR